MARYLTLEQVSENNLKDITVEIPHDRVTAITGLSGSGKSSLAFQAVYAEGQRRYIETFSPYVRQFFDKVKKPELLRADGVRPALAIVQRTKVTSSRSSVGSITDIDEYLKLLWANISTPICPTSGDSLVRWDSSLVLRDVKERLRQKNSPWQRALVGTSYPLPEAKKLREAQLERLLGDGFSRFFDQNLNEVRQLENVSDPAALGEGILLVLDRIRADKISEKRLKDSLSQAFQLGDEGCIVLFEGESEFRIVKYPSGYGYMDPERVLKFHVPEPRPALFSVGSPIGACPECKGFGQVLRIDIEKVVPDPNKTLESGALHCWSGDASKGERRRVLKFAEEAGIEIDRPWRELSEEQRDLLLTTRSRSYRGVLPWFEALERKAYKMHVRVFLSRYRSQVECPKCAGTRLVPDANIFQVNGFSIAEIWQRPVRDLVDWVEELQSKKDSKVQLGAVQDILKGLRGRLEMLVDLGLPYITLGRATRTLSGGETQRVNLAGALGSELVSTQFVLDEPSVGLHARDSQKLGQAIRKLAERGNSVLVVEHDEELIRSSDHVLELGPEAGEHGGEVVSFTKAAAWQGTGVLPPKLTSLKGRELAPALQIKGAKSRNLKGFSCEIPRQCLSVLSGVSGSGKSTLVGEVILEGYRRYRLGLESINGQTVNGFENFSEVLVVDQSGLAKSPRANIATYSGIWDIIRTKLAATEKAELLSLTKSSFSFNVDGGRCPACRGAGAIREDMQFLSDVFVICEECLGRRFQPVVLDVTFLDKNADDWLKTTVDGVLDIPELADVSPEGWNSAEVLSSLGLGHLRLGHSLSELSGGEAQRLKLVPYIADGRGVRAKKTLARQKDSSLPTLLIFDEPTNGLHAKDVRRLIEVLRELVNNGHTVLCVEHNLDLIAHAEWVIDLGPEGGDEGGELLYCGAIEKFVTAKNRKKSHTAEALGSFLTGEDRSVPPEAPASLRAKRQGAQSVLLHGVREHNLKNIDLEIPHNRFVAITGVSGSGKSSIAKDVLYSEGQRRYLDCLSPYARGFVRELAKPDFDEIHGIRPTVCVHQHTFQPSRVSTVATLSEVYNFLRLLFAKIGEQYCPDHPAEVVTSLSPDQIAERVKDFGQKSVRLLAPIIHNRKGNHKEVFARARKAEIDEVRVDGVVSAIGKFEEGLEKNKQHSIDFVWAKIVPARVPIHLIKSAVEEIFAQTGGNLLVLVGDKEFVFSAERACPICLRGFFRPDPEDFSFHSRRGRCKRCDGRGVVVRRGKVEPCGECLGARLSAIGRNVRVGNFTLHELVSFSAKDLLREINAITFSKDKKPVTGPILQEVNARLERLIGLGLEHLSLGRDCQALSSGELQRLRLAAALGTPLSGAMYILDEPSAGLHPLDNRRVLDSVRELRDNGNSVLVIEHDPQSILASEHIIEVGPGGGKDGGEIVFNGSTKKFPEERLYDEEGFQELVERSRTEHLPEAGVLRVDKGHFNNIDDLSLEFPLHRLSVVAGVSGAGKSSLVHGILLPALLELQGGKKECVKDGEGEVRISHPVDRVLLIDSSPIGKNSRSTPASYLKIWDHIRTVFSGTLEARSMGWTASFFSYNSGKGRCSHCSGLGEEKLELNFLADARVECDYCGGTRYSSDALQVHYRGYSISDVLQMTFAEAKEVFTHHRKIHKFLHVACDLGLGYLTLGQSSKTLSGGESQRLKLVRELARPARGHTFYVLDEPSVGLHVKDVTLLMKTLHRLVQEGNTVLLIEHDELCLEASHHILELGPGAGEQGGKVVFEGRYEELARSRSAWGQVYAERKGGGERLTAL